LTAPYRPLPPTLKLHKQLIKNALLEGELHKRLKMGDLREGIQKARKPLNLKDLEADWA